MATQDFLVELGTEELPPKALKPLSDAFTQGIVKGLEEAGVAFGEVESFAAPRRLAVRIRDLADAQPDKSVEKRGPAVKAAFDDSGNPTRALTGFATSLGITPDQLDTMETDKGAWLVYRTVEKGKPTVELMPDLVEKSLAALPIPKRMRWGAWKTEFVRPVHWLILLYGNKVIEAPVMNLKPGNKTRGHRFHCPKELIVPTPADYEVVLKQEGYVLADFAERREQIRAGVAALAEKEAGGKAVIDEDLLDEVEVPEKELRAEYEARSDEYDQPERRLVERLAFGDTAEAEAALTRVTTAEVSFDDLVIERGLALSDVDMGDVSLIDLGASGAAVFAAAAGDLIGPLDTDIGPALFRINGVLQEHSTSFEEAEPMLRDELASDRARRVIDAQIEDIDDLLAGGATVEDLAEQTDMQLGSIAWSAGTQDGIAAYESFRDAAAVAQEGDFAELVDMEDGGVFALRLDSITAPALRDFADVADQVADGWRVQATQTAVLAQAETMAADILPLTGFDTLGLTAQTEAALTRRSFVGGTPPVFMSEVFDMETGDVRVLDNGTDAIIVRLDGVSDADLTDEQTAAQKKAAAENAAAGISQDIFEAFAASVQGRTDVVINQAAVNAVNANFQ